MKSANRTTTTFVFNAGSHVFSISAIPPHPFADCSLLLRVKNVSHTGTFSSSLMFIFTVSMCCSLACVRDKVHVRETDSEWKYMNICVFVIACISSFVSRKGGCGNFTGEKPSGEGTSAGDRLPCSLWQVHLYIITYTTRAREQTFVTVSMTLGFAMETNAPEVSLYSCSY